MKAVAVVGGGITGLTAAHELRRRRPDLAVTVLEADSRLGGKVCTVEIEGRAVDAGPDAFLARVPEGAELCADVGLGDELVAPATGSAYMWSEGQLRPLPPGTALGVPTDLGAAVRAGALSLRGAARATLDLALPRTEIGEDVGVGELVRRRLGREVHERLVDPLLAGIHAGPSELLSAAVGAPQLLEAARGGSLIRTLGRQQRAGAAGPVFLTVRGGLGALIHRLAASAGVVRTGAAVTGLTVGPPGYRVLVDGHDDVEAEAVVLATPAFAAAPVIEPLSPATAAFLHTIEYASVAVVVFAHDADHVGRPLNASGFLVPAREGMLMTACSWGSSKWPHWAAPGTALFRVSAGRAGDERAMALGDDELAARLHEELARTVGVDREPRIARVFRWPRSLPQFRVGHLRRLEEAEAALVADAPGVVLAGAAYRGLGLPACIRQGREAAQAVLRHLDAPRAR